MIPEFRAWHKKRRKIFLVEQIDFGLSAWKKEGGYVMCVNVPAGVGVFYPKEVILMQSTGLKDKNGKEIFEGDIIKYRCKIGMKETSNANIKRVKNEETGMMEFRFYDKYGDFELGKFWVEGTALEVIGNIYENPELIE